MTKIKYNNIIYSIGDVVEVMMYGYPNNSLAEITKVVIGQELGKNSFWPMVKVKWYYSKNDLFNEGALKDVDFISNYEVFSSTHQDPIFVETIVKKVKVIPFLEYEQLTTCNEFTEDLYFTRASYDITKVRPKLKFIQKTLSPSVSKWKKICVCQLPYNPDQLYIQCGDCLTWNHPACNNIKDEEVNDNLTEFLCVNCLGK